MDGFGMRASPSTYWSPEASWIFSLSEQENKEKQNQFTTLLRQKYVDLNHCVPHCMQWDSRLQN